MDESIQQLIDRFNETHGILRMDEIERLRRVEQAAKDIFNYFTKYPMLLPQAQYEALKAALEEK